MKDNYVNLQNCKFDEWVDFIFDYLSDEERLNEWSREVGILQTFRDDFAKKCIRLFKEPEFLLKKYSSEQIEKGFDFIFGPYVLITMWLWDKDADVGLRREFIFSMLPVFEKVFTVNPLENACFMWWDYLRGFNKDKDLRVMEWMFDTISEILKIDSFDCQMSALHGLGHIEHPKKKSLIETFLRRHPNFPEKNYALAAIDGKVL